MKILGLHHITIVCADAQRTVDFYTQVLGLRLLKQTVNFDAPDSYHLYFGDEKGTPGTAITYFEWPGAPKGQTGIGSTHHYALRVASEDGLLKWKRRLTDLGIPVKGPYNRNYFRSIYFQDPDGVNIEIATDGPGWTVDEAADALGTSLQPVPEEMQSENRDEATIKAITWPEPVPVITEDMSLLKGMHHISAIGSNIERTDWFYSELLGMRRIKMTNNFDDANSAHWYWGVDDSPPGTVVTYFERDRANTRRSQMGAGLTHHFALGVDNEDEQAAFQARLRQAGFRVSDIIDRIYFKSIYTTDPDGHIVEIATMGPGFLIDEDDEEMIGMRLKLPAWLEPRRSVIESMLKPIKAQPWRGLQEAGR